MKAKVIHSVAEVRSWRRNVPQELSLGFVPTMGGLHEGHLALVRRAMAENDQVVVSIYLNRPQFNNERDFDTYPASFSDDLRELEAVGVQIVFAPSYNEMYPDDYRYRLSESVVSRTLEGEHRPGHFDGVLTVVLKLLNLVKATRAYFGEKDWQQLQLVKGMVEALFVDTEIVACPTERGEGGLALSSRNRRLSPEGRERARMLNQILNTAASAEVAEASLRDAGFEVEYVAESDGRRLVAAQLEGVRLIDNVPWAMAKNSTQSAIGSGVGEERG